MELLSGVTMQPDIKDGIVAGLICIMQELIHEVIDYIKMGKNVVVSTANP